MIPHENDYAYMDAINALMTANELSQQKFADMVGVNQTTVSQWLLGKKKPTYDSINSIRKAFDVEPNDLFGM